jgi:hypothetical protein
MLTRGHTILLASLAVVATIQMPAPAHAQSQYWPPFFEWLQPVPAPSVELSRPATPATVRTTTPRPQRVAAVEPPRTSQRVLIIGIGF